MKYFKDKDNNLYAYEDNVSEKYIKKGLIPITEMQYKSFKLFDVFDKTFNNIKLKEEEIKIDSNKKEYISQQKQTKIKSLNNLTIKVGKFTLQVNEKSQQAFTNFLASGLKTTQWIDADNNTVELTREQIQEALVKAVQKQTEILVEFNQKRDKINKCKTLDELENIKVEVWKK